MVLYPSWAAVLVAASLWLGPWPWSLALAGLALVTPFAAVVWRDATPELRRSLRALFRGSGLEQARVLRAVAMVRIKDAQAKMGDYLLSRKAELMGRIAKEKALNDALTNELKAAVTEFKTTYK